MFAYLLRRLAALVPVMLIVATVGFVIVRLAPGDPAVVMLGPDASPDRVAELRRDLGLQEPVPVQLLRWYQRVLRADFGRSVFEGDPVTQVIRNRLEPTVLLTLLAMVVAMAIGVPAGVASAVRRNSLVDQLLMGVALLGVSMPSFWLGLNLILVFSLALGLFPVSGYVPLHENWTAALRSLVLPALTLGVGASGLIARMTRSAMLEVLHQDYVRTALAKGVPGRRVLVRHALRNALIPVVTVIGLSMGTLLAGAVTVETVFAIPGVGLLVISSVLRRDLPVIQGVLLFAATVYVLVNLLVDLIYVYLDPRITYV
ncbi:MAG: ABC transporter permease [Armatimonadota bacterium]|nr:ABC transporter permease [Armatimonadota bacterium]MDR7448709.1 ABC transporter permease [Armatimonadota bacterium]MDR7460271.1 ABC transporter permease [Armatimonadota bacterium]MDR7479047.1 ABC transporter permease [Armatimonadota bacterium]MDR7502678.1 ABC transporter permease [Armatimonadota bacterium]